MGIMWTVIVVAVIAFNVDYYYNRKIGSATGTAFIVLVISAIVLVLILAMASNFPKDVTTKLWHTTNIHSLKDAGTTYKGSFVLGSGSIDSQMHYTAYAQTDDGFYKEKFEQAITYIKEGDGVTPRVEKYIEVTTMNWVEGWLLGRYTQNGCCYTKYILYVPRGTIIKKFSLD